ncbi:MAG: methyltransferase domain-containing protein, partial [Alphaproteobacteria bacterium]|nr:methyltransferase domain-containing protein [Alphaproteobacteria bacterium]
SVIGLEPSEGMRALCFEKGFSASRFNMVAGGYQPNKPLPFDDAHFDIFMSCGVLEWIEFTPHVFSEFMRVVKPGGHLAFSYRTHAARDDHEKHVACVNPPLYVHSYSPSAVRSFLKNAGSEFLSHERTVGFRHGAREFLYGLIVVQKPLKPHP